MSYEHPTVIADLTQRQWETLRFIHNYIKREGIPPSVSDIAFDAGGWTSSTRKILNHLEEKGYIRRHKKVSRGIVLVRMPEPAGSTS